MQYRSIAVWPDTIKVGHIVGKNESSDIHRSKEEAEGVCRLLERLGFGCSGKVFPLSTRVELVEETRANLIVSNRVGIERDMKFKGGSCIIDRDRRIWTNGSNFTEAAVVGGIVVTG